jgi:hypothetical protein
VRSDPENFQAACAGIPQYGNSGDWPLLRQQSDRVVRRGDETLRAVLVEHDWDGVGLLAMTIYEQHRANMNFREKSTGPDEYACHVFELAEHTPRRLASYQQLAEARLAQRVSPAPVGATESF